MFLRSIGKRQVLQPILVTVLYVRNLSNKTTEEQLYIVFSMGGTMKLERVKKLRDFAFIHYCRREDAELALEQFDGMILDGCILEVTWAKPPETQKQKLGIDKNPGAYFYRQINYDNLDHSFDINMPQSISPISSFSLFPRTSTRQRMQLSNVGNLSSSFTVTRPIQLLGYLCIENSWGSPIFQISRIDSEPSEIFYVCWVFIPSLPSQARRFMSERICRSPEEAKHYAACHVLKKLGVIDADFPYNPSSPSLHNIYPNMSKSFLASNSANVISKPVSNFGLCTSPKNTQYPSFKASATPPPNFFCESGQGDAGNILTNPPSMDAFDNDDIENCTPLLDPDTPIEPNSLLGLLSSLAAATNVDLPLFNKPKL